MIEQSEPTARALPPTLNRQMQALALDLLIVLFLVLLVSLVIPAAIITLRLLAEGRPPVSRGALEMGEALRLIGADGIVLTLLVQNLVFAGVPLVRTLVLRREPLTSLGLGLPGLLRQIGFGLVLAIIVLIGNVLIGLVFSLAGMEQNQAAQYPLFQGDYVGQALFLIGAAVLVPIGEEILFRGYLFRSLQRIGQQRVWGLPLAFVGSSLLFAMAHSLAASEGVIVLLTATFLMGMLLAWSVYRSGSIIPAIIAHAANNGLALVALITCINQPWLNGCS